MGLISRTNQSRLLYAIIAIGIFARIFSLVVLPEATYADSFYHAMLSRDVMQYGTLDLPLSLWEVPPPLYYLLFSSVFLLSGFPITQFSIKILPLLFLALQVLLFFLISRRLFAENWKVPFSLFTLFPLAIRYGSVNYTENLAMIFVLASTYLILRLRRSQGHTVFSLLPLVAVLGALSISKLNGTVLVPIFVFAVVYFLLKNRAKKRTIAIFLAAVLLISGLWFGMNLMKFGMLDRFGGGEDIATAGRIQFDLFGRLPYYASTAHLYFWDFPPLHSFQEILPMNYTLLLAAAVLFSLVVLPLYLVLACGFRSLLIARRKYFFCALAALTAAIFSVIVISRTIDMWHSRLILPILPFIAILFGYGCRKRKGCNPAKPHKSGSFHFRQGCGRAGQWV